jgi:tRNA(fMet)-specific endonuclease VapC
MDKEIICIDTSLFIDYFRKLRKDRTLLAKLSADYDFSISVITKLEIGVGVGKGQKDFWNDVFEKLTILPLTEIEIDKACEIIQTLRKKEIIKKQMIKVFIQLL